jgi:beta-lactamase regulating signal transducer with metallopeptidase domain
MTAHLLQSTAFALIAAILTLGFRRNQAQIRYGIWLSASLKFLLPYSFLVAAGRHWGFAHPVSSPEIHLVARSLVIAYTQPPTHPLPTAGGLIPILWACGSLAIVLIRLRLWLPIRRALRTSTPGDLPAIRFSRTVFEPGVAGWWRPTLLLPEGIVERLTPPQFKAVLAHELCHIRRRDNLFAALHMLVEALFWFHPLVWWIGARLIDERERACDESVLSEGVEPQTYADAILNVCRFYIESRLACVSGVTGSPLKRNLKQRIEAIMTNHQAKRLPPAKKFLLACAGFSTLAGPIAMGLLTGTAPLQVLRAQPPIPSPTRVSPVQASPAAPAKPRLSLEPAATDSRPPTAVFLDLSGLTAAGQIAARQSALTFLRSRMPSTGKIAVLGIINGGTRIFQDFTDDEVLLTSAILSLPAGEGAPDPALRLAHLRQAAVILAAISEKKLLVYYASGENPSGMQIEIQAAVDAAKKANVALEPLDLFRAGSIAPRPRNLVSFEFENAPPPLASFEGEPGAELAGTSVASGLPGKHTRIKIYTADDGTRLQVPLDAVSGRIEIVAVIQGVSGVAANLRDSVSVRSPSANGFYQAGFKLTPGAYTCGVVVTEQSTGRVFGETIHFDVP